MKVETTKKKIASTYLTSMTDVIFLLLIFLMLASNFITQTGINVRLPGSSSGVQHNLKAIEVIYNKDHQIIINNILMDMEQFKSVLPTYFLNKDQVVRLVADKDASLQEVISLMDIIRNTGFEKITIATYQISRQTNENQQNKRNR
ncbi:MAG: ExbD/TolR family protein [Candidatus Cloacimonadaceae bacterium]